MSRAKRERKLLALLLACALLAWGTAALAAGQGRRTETGYAAVQLAAADLLEDCFRQVRTYKEELGIPLSELDYHQTGMIGESYTGITTTLGAIEAKRTTAWPEMGALCVRLLHEAGVRSGDTVGAGFSGSFPAMDLAVIAAFRASDIGFDRSLIGAYGHDDRVCAYASLAALLQLGTPERTAVCMLADKEEIGSEGVSGMKSRAFDTFMEDLCQSQSVPLRACYEKSFCLSADVTAAYDPNFAEVYEKRNSAFVNYGMGLCKYTGARGKSGASDASAELVAYVRRVLDGAGVVWQMAELGKADQGGGGTVAVFMAERNIDTLDAGVPVLSMHAPFETVSKLDCYMTYKGMKAIYEAV